MNVGGWLPAAAFLTLVLVLGAAAYADLAWRRIPNGLCAAVALSAPVFVLTSQGWVGLGDLAVRIGAAFLVGAVLALLFMMRQIGGGDVKLASAALLWIPPHDMPIMLMTTVAVGGIMAIGLKVANRLFNGVSIETVPYGAAIVSGTLFALSSALVPLAINTCAAMT